VGLCDLHPVCVSVYPPPSRHQLLNAWTHLYEIWYVYHGTWANLNCLLHTSLPSVCVCMCMPPIVARQWLNIHIPVAMNTWNKEELLYASFSVWSVSYQRRVCGVCLCIPLPLQGNGSVHMLLQQWRILGGVIFYAVHVISKESRWLVLPRTSCL
jgi:hypothetical protein